MLAISPVASTEETDDGIWSLYFMNFLLGKIDEREMAFVADPASQSVTHHPGLVSYCFYGNPKPGQPFWDTGRCGLRCSQGSAAGECLPSSPQSPVRAAGGIHRVVIRHGGSSARSSW